MSAGQEASRFRTRAARALKGEPPPAEVTGPVLRKLVADSAAMLKRGPLDARSRASAARQHALDNLEELHDRLRSRLEARGVTYHRCSTGEGAAQVVRDLLGDARRVAKSKTMVGEEIGLTPFLREGGLAVLETDIGEYIVDIEGQGPSHVTAPALHLNRSRIKELLAGAGSDVGTDDPVTLSRHIRDIVSTFFDDCDATITGANTTIAGSGRLVAVENEGNVALGVSHPAKHIVVTGLEKIVAEDEDALAILEVLAPSATAQPLTAFTHLLGDPPPGQERHVVFVDNGRSEILANERYRDILRCIRCGACMNACPVYTVAGGLAYGSPYMGPVGAVLSPLLWPEGGFSDLPGASSLCGRCSEVCPVGIPIHRMLLDLRADDGYAQTTGFAEKAAWKLWAATYGDPARARIAGTSGRVLARLSSALPFVSLPLGAATEERARARREPRNEVAYSPDPAPEAPPNERIALLIQRLQDLGVKVVPQKPSARDGDRVLGAAAAVAGTGSLLLTGSSASRREILAAERVIVRVDPGTVVDHPNALAPYISDGQDSLILTGASRTADIEKQIVRGIHGTEELVVVVGPTSSHRESEIPVTPGGR